VYRERVGQGGRWFVARVHENEKNPVNVGLQGLVWSPEAAALPGVVWWWVVTLAVAPAAVARATQDRVKKQERF
jgi:hypothetical protein